MARTASTKAADIQAEAIAGLFWMYLNLPSDVMRSELEFHADGLISSIQAGASEQVIEHRLKALQTAQLCQPLNVLAIKQLTRRIFQSVKPVERDAIRFSPMKRAG